MNKYLLIVFISFLQLSLEEKALFAAPVRNVRQNTEPLSFSPLKASQYSDFLAPKAQNISIQNNLVIEKKDSRSFVARSTEVTKDRKFRGPLSGILTPEKKYPFRITANMYRDVLTYSVRSKDWDGTPGQIRGKELYDAMMQHFGGNVKIIHEDWTTSEPDNYNSFLKLINEGKSQEEAVWGTWSGKQAQRLGFNHFKITQARRGYVTVLFSKVGEDLASYVGLQVSAAA